MFPVSDPESATARAAARQADAAEELSRSSIETLEAQRSTAIWTKRMAIATLTLALSSTLFSVLTYLKNDPAPERRPLIVQVGVERGDADTTRERNHERLVEACEVTHADFAQYQGFDATAPYAYNSCNKILLGDVFGDE